ncbi:hypothetical protein K437DRAFT_180992 [Tilletiaria anomala UBC 951]|uniref:Uncharacterized protein n=1 Tax=Tilletiaria anomala (strain ATCC 24038 / CBS 436.72 / UBC 951) TaxID=1037660 RepID=A0A066VGV1_TILAU|nr:uncharacterized protein K437DRAFT_180992 [Tilletiaria anomala UBC 951]KDN40952.1 hypothetical protein K437DRAFT_180992 [Tilletiaria anomala UBC 951]
MTGSNSSGCEPLLPSHRSQEQSAKDYGATAQQKENPAAGQAKQITQQAHQSLQRAKPDIEYAVAALKAGKLPSTEQLSKWVDYLQSTSIFQTGPYNKTGALSEEGERIISDFKNVLYQLKQLAELKNDDDKFQRFMYHSSQASIATDLSDPSAFTPSQRQLRKDSERAVNALRKLGWLIVTDEAFNHIIADLFFASRELLADAASVASDKIREVSERARPSESAKSASGVEKRDTALGIGHGRMSSESEENTKQKGRVSGLNVDADKLKRDVKDLASNAKKWIEERTGSSEDAKDDLIERLKKTIISIQEHEEYQESVDVLIDLIKKYGKEVKSAAEQAKEDGKEKINANDHVDKAARNLKAIVEAFANGKCLDPVLDAFKQVAEDIRKDGRLSAYFSEVSHFIERCLKDSGYVTTSKASRRIDSLYDRAQELQNSNSDWKKDAQNLSERLQEFSEALCSDEDSCGLLVAFQKLGADLETLAEQTVKLLQGQAHGLYRDIADVWLPRVLSSISHVPLPKIEFKSADVDVIVDGINLAASSGNFIPDRIQILNRNEVQLHNGYAAFATTFDSEITVRVEGLRIMASDVAFYIHRKNAYFHRRDWGLLSLDASSPKGISLMIHLENAKPEDRESYMKVKKVDVDISQLNISVRQSHHPIQNFLFIPLARPALRTIIGKLLEEQISSALEDSDKQLFAMHERSVALSKYSGAAFNPFSSAPGGGGTPSITGYFNALFGSGINPFSLGSGGSSSVSVGKRGIVKKGRSGEWLLAIGSPQPIIDADAGPKGWAEKHRREAEEAKRKFEMLTSKGKAELRKSAAETDAKASEMAKEDDWRSDAFDIPV